MECNYRNRSSHYFLADLNTEKQWLSLQDSLCSTEHTVCSSSFFPLFHPNPPHNFICMWKWETDFLDSRQASLQQLMSLLLLDLDLTSLLLHLKAFLKNLRPLVLRRSLNIAKHFLQGARRAWVSLLLRHERNMANLDGGLVYPLWKL